MSPRKRAAKAPVKAKPLSMPEVVEWAERLEPDFSNRGHSGGFFVLLSWVESNGGSSFYALGTGNSEEAANVNARAYAVTTRWQQVMGPQWAMYDSV